MCFFRSSNKDIFGLQPKLKNLSKFKSFLIGWSDLLLSNTSKLSFPTIYFIQDKIHLVTI